eukprot:m.224902 g.224902  ORF g.224902 m.224902 type:complete len:467 (+) comp15155_c0_seq2:72-1472(+)
MFAGKEKEGLALLAQAEAEMKTSLFKWSVDFDVAAQLYTKAALALKLAKNYPKAIETYRKAADCHLNPKCSSTPYHAAEALQQAATCARDAKDSALSIRLLKEAAQHLRSTGNFVGATEQLEKAAKQCMRTNDFEAAAELWLHVYDIFKDEDKARRCKDPIANAIVCCLRLNDFQKVLSLYDEQADLLMKAASATFCFQSVLAKAIIQIAQDDAVAAQRTLDSGVQRFSGFGASREYQLGIQFLEAIEREDQSAFDVAKSDHTVTFLGNDVAIMCRKMRMPSGAGLSSLVPVKEFVPDTPTRTETPKEEHIPSPPPSVATQLQTPMQTQGQESPATVVPVEDTQIPSYQESQDAQDIASATKAAQLDAALSEQEEDVEQEQQMEEAVEKPTEEGVSASANAQATAVAGTVGTVEVENEPENEAATEVAVQDGAGEEEEMELGKGGTATTGPTEQKEDEDFDDDDLL